MTTDRALEIITKIITNTLEEYDQSPDSKIIDDQGVETRKPHPLDIVDDPDKLFVLDMSIKGVALKAAPISLLETTGSTASELRRVSTDYFIRVPVEPVSGIDLDIDDGLSYAVVFKSLSSLWREYGDYEQKADSIINTYIQSYRKYLADLIAGEVGAGAETYIRFSVDGVDWHGSYTAGDIYISFKKIDTDSWTPAIPFVGGDGTDGTDGADGQDCSDTNFSALQDTPASYTGFGEKIVAVKADETGVEFIDAPSGGGGSSTFKDLTDTPATLTADKWMKVNAAGDAIEFTDAPSGGGLAGANVFGDKIQFDDSCSGSFEIDAENNNIFYLYPTANLEIKFKQFDDDGTDVSAWWGTTYTFLLVSSGGNAITFIGSESMLGDNSVGLGSDSGGTNITMTMLKMVYTGYDWYVVSRNVITDANG